MTQGLSDFLDVLFGYRKFLIMFALLSIAVFFRLKGYIDGSNFVDLMKATTLSFFAANGFEHMGNVTKTYLESKGLTDPSKEAK